MPLLVMVHQFYFPVLWLVIATFVVAIFVVTGGIGFFNQKISENADLCQQCSRQISFLQKVRWVLWAFALLFAGGGVAAWSLEKSISEKHLAELRNSLTPVFEKEKLWEAPDFQLAEISDDADLIKYGRDLIANTQDYFGENGIVRPRSINSMNCQNCHLDAGAKVFGNNYFAVASTYPQQRARSGTLETIPKRINDCFQRSLDGQPLDSTSREMQAIVAYMNWLGTAVPRGSKPRGAGLVEVPLLDRAADPVAGKKVYDEKCASCHAADGQGLPMPNSERRYPPLWGEKSYNEGAGLFRLSRFAGYVKANMPFGARFDNPQLSDAEAWDVAAFVNSQPRPAHPFLKTDWPKIEKKPFDHPFGPFADSFSEAQHKFGPFQPIINFYKK